jgi:hypothetical protein
VTGETDLATLLRTLDPALDPVEYGFGVLASGAALRGPVEPLCLFREDEGMTVIAAADALDAAGIAQQRGWARITLRVHSSLQAVGLTAAVSGALAAAGISANVVAAYRHDHVFVPWDRRRDALAVLQACASGMDGAQSR